MTKALTTPVEVHPQVIKAAAGNAGRARVESSGCPRGLVVATRGFEDRESR
jgi:hypothetical protein